MTRPGFLMGILLVGLVALGSFPMATALGQGTDPLSPWVLDEGLCLAWDITGEWQSKGTGGAVGTETFSRDKAGRLQGSWYNASTGESGDYERVKVSGASIFLRTGTGHDYHGTVDPNGTGISGSYAFDSLKGAWQANGRARCLQRAAPQVPGAMVVIVDWGPYRFRTSHRPGSNPGPEGVHGSHFIDGRPTSLSLEQNPGRFSSVGRSLLSIQAETWNHAGDTRARLEVWDRVTVLHPTEPFERLRKVGTLPQTEQTPGGQRFEGEISIEPFLDYVSPELQEVHEVYVQAPAGTLVSVVTIDMLLIEPMGAVLDAGSEKAIEGAAVALLRKDGGQWSAWDARSSGQTNPTVTGAKGGYGWDMPQGDYMARVSKRCFQDASSTEVEVPPSPTGVEIGLTPVACSDLWIKDLWLSDGGGIPQVVFQPGHDVRHHLVVSSTAGADTAIDISWQVSDPQGEMVEELSGSTPFVVPPFGGHLPIPGQVPAGAAAGKYTLSASFTHQDQTSFRATQFSVIPPTWVYLPLIHSNDVGGDWLEIITEDFEGATFPGKWEVIDQDAGQDGKYYWGKSACRAATGMYSGWAVGDGVIGEKLECGDNYPDEAYSWMTYGPFSLADATSAELRFKRWVNTVGEEDSLQYLASIDDNEYQGFKIFGSTPEWRETVFDLRQVPILGDLTGQPQVWVRFVFEARVPNTRPEGAYIDDIVLRKWVPATGRMRGP